MGLKNEGGKSTSLTAFVGELGTGKTLSLTFLAFLEWKRGRKIFSNYWLKFPHSQVRSVSAIANMKNGFFAGDELWHWIDSRESSKGRNKIVSKILLQSRKVDVDIGYTAQHFRQIDVRIRNVTDFLVTPIMLDGENWKTGEKVKNAFCKYRISKLDDLSKFKEVTFRTAGIFKFYDTRERIKEVEEDVKV